jgi:prepilin-type N-terminal cleavage/methylation domain-containing protein
VVLQNKARFHPSKVKIQKGFTLIEVLVSMVLLTMVVFLASGLVLPLKLTKTTGVESQAVNYGRSYLEVVKARWQSQAAYISSSFGLPVADSTATADVKIPSGWSVSVDTSTWTTSDTIRTVEVVVKPSSDTKTWIKLLSRITRPS